MRGKLVGLLEVAAKTIDGDVARSITVCAFEILFPMSVSDNPDGGGLGGDDRFVTTDSIEFNRCDSSPNLMPSLNWVRMVWGEVGGILS